MKIAIWGAGKFGRYIANQLVTREDVEIVGFIDSDRQIVGKKVDGFEVMTLLQMQEQQVDFMLIAIVDYLSVLAQFRQEDAAKMGIIKANVYRLKQKLSENIFEDDNIVWLKNIDVNKPVLHHLETNIVDNCNLNCRGCSHFSNLFAHDEHVLLETFCRDLRQIAEHTFVAHFYLLGGEPLLCEQLTDYIEFARKELPLSVIEIVSNGLLIPKQSEKFFDCCRKNDILFSITAYPPTLAMKEKIVQTLEDNKIKYVFRQDVLDFGKNIDLQGKANPKEAYKRCRESECHFFRNGKLHKCPFEALGNHLFKHYDVDIRFDGGADIYDPELSWEKLVKALDEEPVDACCYCGEEERMDWKVEYQPKLEDWVINKL